MSKRINGTGTVYKLSDVKRRRPWVAKVTRGFEESKKENGIPKFKQSYKVIGYYENKKEAEEALNNFIGVSYEKDALRLLFSDVYTQWKNSNEQLSNSSKTSYNAAFNALSHLHDLYFDSIKTADIELAITKANKNYPMIKKMQILLNQLYNYAIGNDIVDKNYSIFVKFDKYKKAYKKKIKNVYKESEIEYIWKHSGELIYRILLMLLYTGLRINELLQLKTKDLNLQERYITITNSKTNNGIRKVPIPSCIYQMVKHQYNEKKEYFLYDGAYKYNYGQIRVLFDNFKKKSNMNHTIHETRHTYTSRLRLRGVDSTFTKKLTGHSAGNVDEDTYTHIGIGDLYKIVNDAFEEDMKYVG